MEAVDNTPVAESHVADGDFEISQYGIFSDAFNTNNVLKTNIVEHNSSIANLKSQLSVDSVFMGPICENCVEAFDSVTQRVDVVDANLGQIGDYLAGVADNYTKGDKKAMDIYLAATNVNGQLKITTSRLDGSNPEEQIYNYLIAQGYSPAGAAGIMGNLVRESGYIPSNVQDGMGYSDEAYVEGLKNGTISREDFIYDSRGFGLAQWTYWSLKRDMYDALGPENIDSLPAQLDFLTTNMSPELQSMLKNATNPSQAADIFHNYYERSADTTLAHREYSASQVYNKYANV